MIRIDKAGLRAQIRRMLLLTDGAERTGAAEQLLRRFGVHARASTLEIERPAGPRNGSAAPVASTRLYFEPREQRSPVTKTTVDETIASLLIDDRLVVRLNAAIALGHQDRTLVAGGKAHVRVLLEGTTSGDRETAIWCMLVFSALTPAPDVRPEFDAACSEAPGARLIRRAGSAQEWVFGS